MDVAVSEDASNIYLALALVVFFFFFFSSDMVWIGETLLESEALLNILVACNKSG